MDPEDAGYKCTLSAYSLEKARKELNEDPKQRMGQVQVLRKWIKEQPHFTSRTDTMFLLAMLRRAKFSQLEARRLIENIVIAKTLFPEYMNNVDIQDPGVLAYIEKGVVIYPPKPDKEGRKMAIIRIGLMDPDDPLLTPLQSGPVQHRVGEMLKEKDEEICVNGWQFVLDCTGVGPRHLARMPMEFHRKISKIFQDSNPERVKGFHYYNVGTIMEVLMSMVKQFMKKKHQERVQVHDTMESLYKAIPMELWPDEYLPDDYKGPSAGSIASIQAALKKRMMDPATRERVLDYTSDRYKIDESKRPADPAPNESFRETEPGLVMHDHIVSIEDPYSHMEPL